MRLMVMHQIYSSLLIVFLVSLAIVPATTLSAYRVSYPLKHPRGTLYMLYFRGVIERFGDYGVFTAYLKPDGIYAYGIILLKDPGEDGIHAYLMAGTQDKWIDLGLLKSRNITLIILVDPYGKIMLARLNNETSRINLTETSSIDELYIAALNITGRNMDYPIVNISRLLVYTANNTLKKYPGLILDDPYKIAEVMEMAPVLNITEETRVPQTTGTTRTTPRGEGLPGYLVLTAVSILVAAAALIAAYFIYRSERTGSPGP